MTDEVHPDDEDLRKAESLGEYLHFLNLEWQTMTWLFAEFTTPLTRRWSYAMVLCLVIQMGLGIGAGALVGFVINGHLLKDYDRVVGGLSLLFLAYVLLHVFAYVGGIAREWVLGLNFCRMDERIAQILFQKPLGQHERYASELSQASIEKGYWKVMTLEETIIFRALPAFVAILVALLGLWFVSPVIGAFATLMTVCFTFWSLWLNTQVVTNVYPIEREFRRIRRIRFEQWEKIVRVITGGHPNEERRRLDTDMANNMARDRSFWIWFIRQYDMRSVVLQRLFQVAVFAYGSYLVYQGEWQLGILFPLLLWVDILVTNLNTLSDVERHMGREIVSIQLMIKALTIPPSYDVEEGTPLQRNGPLGVEFKDVAYHYLDNKSAHANYPVLRGINFSIAPGEKVALLGPSGAGKTTIMKLLLRFEDPTEGAVLINGTPLRDLKLSSYMGQVGYIPQQAQILDMTLEENLLYGVGSSERERLRREDSKGLWELMYSLKIDFGTRLTRGLQTLVGRHGLKLSGGQAQRVMIGAAVAKRPRLMIIDEATSSLDSTTEKEVQEGLSDALAQGTTALIVAHRLSTVRDLCDRFIVLRPLDEVTEGMSQIEAVANSFEELAIVSPTFRQLASDQGVVV